MPMETGVVYHPEGHTTLFPEPKSGTYQGSEFKDNLKRAGIEYFQMCEIRKEVDDNGNIMLVDEDGKAKNMHPNIIATQ